MTLSPARSVEVCAYDGYEESDPNHERAHWPAVEEWRASPITKSPVPIDDDCDCRHPFADHYVTGECRVCDCGDDEDLEEF